MRIIDIVRRLDVEYYIVHGWLKTFDHFIPAPSVEGSHREYGEGAFRVIQRIHDLKVLGHSNSQVRAALAKEAAAPTTETYALCESRNCAARALPGRRFCELHRRLEAMPQGMAAVVQVPANRETRAALLSVVKAAQENLATGNGERPSWVATPQAAAPGKRVRRAVVGYWCRRCRQLLAIHFKSCRCLAEVEDARHYAEFKARYWNDCFVEVPHV